MLLVSRMFRDRLSFDALGRFAVRRRWWIVAAWAVLVLVAAVPFAPRAPAALSAGGFILDDLESARAKQLLQDKLGVEASAFVLLYTSDTLTAGTPEWQAAVEAATRDVAGAPHVTRVLSHVLAPRQVAADGHTAYDIVFLDLPPDDSPDAIPGRASARLHEVPGLTVRIGGGPAFYGDVQAVTETDLRRSELISLPLAALALVLVFGSLVAAGRAARRRRRGGARGAGGDLRRRVADADEHLRAQPRDAPRARAGRRLLAADDEPLPRGAGEPRRAGPGRRGRPGDGRDGRAGGVLLRPDRAPRAARASCCSSS